MKHRHAFGPWVLHKEGPNAHLPDKEFVASLRLEPFWTQKCDCGYEHHVRTMSKPRASFRFRELSRR